MPKADATYSLSATRGVKLAAAYADYSQASFGSEAVINNPDTKTKELGRRRAGRPSRASVD